MLEIQNVSHRYANSDGASAWALRNISLTIADGTFVSFIGTSGCGKTTLLRIADGLIRPTEGKITIDGALVKGPSLTRAMVFQEFNLMPWRTASSNVEFPLEIMGMDGPQRRAASAAALEKVGLSRFAGFYPHQLSGGMKQRVGLARALVTGPSYLFMDEPFGALDPQIREMMQIDLMRLWDADRKTVIFVTHSVDEAVFLSDRIIVFGGQPGRVVSDIPVNLPRPRWADEEALKASPEFQELRQSIWRLLKSELNIAIKAEFASTPTI